MTTSKLPRYAKAPDKHSKAKYLRLLKRWPFHGKQHGCRKRIAIIGAGMAGLVAGWLLKRAGHEVRIYEAGNVVGGRVKTLRHGFTSRLYAEAGAMRIPEHHKLTLWLTKELFKLPTIEFFGHSPNGRIYINDKHVTFSDYDKHPAALGFELEEHEQRMTADQLFKHGVAEYARKVSGSERDFWQAFNDVHYRIGDTDLPDDVKPYVTSTLDALDRCSLREFLIEHATVGGQHLSPRAIDLIVTVMNQEMQLATSMTAILNDYIELSDDVELCQIAGGMDLLPRSFLGAQDVEAHNPNHATVSSTSSSGVEGPDLFEQVWYNVRVTEIRQESPGVRVHYQYTVTGHKDQAVWDLVVITVPFSALRHIRMPELISVEKQRAIRQLHYDNACKVILEFSSRFWSKGLPDDKRIDGGRSITDLSARQIYYPSPKQYPGRRSLLLASYTWGDDSLRWTALNEEERILLALGDLEHVHQLPPDELKPICIGGLSHSWAEDEFASGAFAMFEPFQGKRLFEAIWKPERRLHFAGEHTSTKHGWIEGAVESGVRVANEICHRLKADPDLAEA